MSRRWLLSLLCLSVLIVTLAPLTRARGELKVIEARTRFLLGKEPAEVLLAVENSTGEALNGKVEVEILDSQDRVISKVSNVQSIGTGNQTLKLSLPLDFPKLKDEDRHFLWHRLRYRVSKEGQNPLSEGIVSLSEITPDLFELRVATAEVAREGTRYRARVIASHPVTHKPAANVLVEAELTLEDDNDKSVKLRNSKTTDDHGYALFDFVVPDRFPQFPHTMLPDGGELRVTGKRGAFVAEAEGKVLVDQFTKTLITTDKPLYQPGQVMHLRALVFSPSRRALANQNILFRVRDPEGTTVCQAVAKSSRFGIAITDWNIPDNVRLGVYRILVSVEGVEELYESQSEVRISRYDLPNFSVSVQSDREYYLPGQNAEVRVRADYLFGQPVKRGRVRVIRENDREWNYREQKWDVVEGTKHEGETDANGVFVARIDLSDDQDDLGDSYYRRYRDLTYAAYFTDPTTNRTEQRRFDLRVTQDAIHVYVVRDTDRNRTLPQRFYVSAAYADGSPARCKVNIALSTPGVRDSRGQKQEINLRQLLTIRTNRYGVAKVSGVRLPREFDDMAELNVGFSAIDSNGRTGKRTEELRFDDDPTTYVETEKVIHRAGEPIIASITSSLRDETVVVDLYRESNIIRTERVRLRNGRGSITFPYGPDLKDRVTIVAYSDYPYEDQNVETQTILYPRNTELQVNARTSQTTYRPGENAHVNLSVRAPEGRGAESALGVIVLDRAVEDRYRTVQEFGGSYGSFNASLQSFLGYDEQIGGVTLRDLQRLDTTSVISPDLDLVAEVLLNQSRDFSPRFFGGDESDSTQSEVFADLVRQQLASTKEALTKRYLSRAQHPKNEAELRSFLLEDKIDLNRVLDPWGVAYKPVYSVEGPSDVLTLNTAGADKRFGTTDDFSVDRFSWRYFLNLGTTIDRVIRQHHERTKGFIRDYATLREEMSKAGAALDQLRDRWGEPYRFEFDVNESSYVLTISSGGSDKVFARDKDSRGDDFVIWLSSVDYFAESRAQIENTLDQNLRSTKKFPQTIHELRKVLSSSETPFDSLRDPWGRAYYANFITELSYGTRAELENRANMGEKPATHVNTTPVTRRVATIRLRSMGPDGVSGTADDFSLAMFRGVVSEPERTVTGLHWASQVDFTGISGAISGEITDFAAARIPKVKVTVIPAMHNRRYETEADDAGNYTVSNLSPGIYEVHFDALGFKKTIVTNVRVSGLSVTKLDVSLEAGQINEAVTVSSEPSMALQTDASANASRTTSDSISFRIVGKSGGAQITTPHLREYFPETLVWQPSLETDKRGRAKINFKLADNITTWKLAVLGSTEDGRIGTTETEIKSFQPFFVDHDPPRVLTEGDEISLPVVVRNYLRQAQKVDLELKPENWFSLLGPAHKRSSVAAGDASRETFHLRAVSSIKDGKQRITAVAADGNDAIEKPVTVHPDGEELSVTDSEILGSSATLQLELPENMIPNSSQAEVKIYPNLMAHVIESVEAIMKRPYGCGEQTISSTYPSLLIVRHGKVTGEDSPMRARAERFLSLGYSRLLGYRDKNGGFTYWGNGQPDVALTAYALRFLNDAGKLMPVDEEVISDAQEWLIKQQQPDGSWQPNYGGDREDIRRSAILTAYIARVLASSRGEQSKEIADALKRAIDYLGARAAEFDEPYLLASYALTALDAKDAARAKPLIEKLVTLARREGSTIYWDLKSVTPFYGWGTAGQVETTALVIQALTRSESDPKLISGALLFLLKQKDRYGVWSSTQATINVLDAMLSPLATQPARQRTADETAEIVVNDRLAQTVRLAAASNRFVAPVIVDISKFLRTGKNAIRIKRPEGSAFASVQATASFYGPWADVKPRSSDLRLQTKCDKTEAKVGDEITCHVEAERVDLKRYGMMLAEIGIPPGADVDRSSLEKAMRDSGRGVNQYDVLPDRVVVYLWPSDGRAGFDFKFRPRFGLNAKSAPSVLYDYYNPDARAVVPPATFKFKEK